MKPKCDETKLPKWAQKRLADLRLRIQRLERLREAHAVLKDREWFVINGPVDPGEFPNDIIRLFVLSQNSAHAVCSLGQGDTLLVGRAERRNR